MDLGVYWQYLDELVQEALENSDRTNESISNYLRSKKKPGRLTRNRHEKAKALEEAIRAFDDHRRWPEEIVLSHLGIDKKSLNN
ncbi:MAG: hypothetical protein KAS38_22060 [Anaerolineales bacterium]|nr:hypothetical protein [Anaerolineales bacterium]